MSEQQYGFDDIAEAINRLNATLTRLADSAERIADCLYDPQTGTDINDNLMWIGETLEADHELRKEAAEAAT